MSASRVLMNVELIQGELWGRVILHQVHTWEGPIACHTYSTGGLAGRHPELVFTRRVDDREEDDVIPIEPFQLFTGIYQQAIAKGQRLRAGEVLELREQRLFDHHILFVDAQILEEVELPLDALALQLVAPDELRAVREYGAGRVLARLGQAAGFYPYPSWADPRRRELSLRETFATSVLGKVPRVASSQFQVTGVGDRVELVIQAAARPLLVGVQQLGDDTPLALATMIYPRADPCLVWEPGQAQAHAIAPPGSRGDRIAGCFVVFLPGQDQDGGRLLEDGFAITLTRASWQALRQALLAGTELSLPGGDGNKSFSLTWAREPHVRPMTGMPYSDETGWSLPADVAAAPAPRSRIQIAPPRLLTDEDDVGVRSSPREIAMMCVEIQRVAERVLAGQTGAFAATVALRCTPTGHTVQLTHRGAASPALLARLHDGISGLARLPVREGDVSFELDLTLVG